MAALTHRHETRGSIDRSQPLHFSFNNQPCLGFVGDTLASALLANDIHIIGQSLKFDRPRGINGTGWDDTNAFISLNEDETKRVVLASKVELYEGLVAESLAPWPPASFMSRLSRKEPPRADISAAKHHMTRADYISQTVTEHCDILVIGSGPAGLAAAIAARNAGQRVIIVEQDSEFGGSLLWCATEIGSMSGHKWLSQTLAELQAEEDIALHARSQAVGFDDLGRICVLSSTPNPEENSRVATGQRFLLRKIYARQTILATGADERALTIPGNDTPGVMRASTLAAFGARFGIACSDAPAVLATNNDDGYELACQLYDLGFGITSLIDSRQNINSELVGPLVNRGINLLGGHVIAGIEGEEVVQSVTLRKLINGAMDPEETTLPCSFVALSGGWNPRLEVLEAAGGALRYDDRWNALVAADSGLISQIIGSATGDTSLEHAITTGWDAGKACALENGATMMQSGEPPTCSKGLSNLHYKPIWKVQLSGIGRHPQQWVDLRTETTVAQLSRQTKKASSSEGSHFLGPLEDAQMQAQRSDVSIEMLMTKFDIDIATPRRRLPTHAWHVGQGAAFKLAQQWLLPALYPREGMTHEEAIQAEVSAARNAVALHDLSAVGKLEVTGNDARQFLDHLFTCNIASLKVGQTRFGMMLSESGAIVNSGIVACLHEDHFLINTTTGAGGSVSQWMREWHARDMSQLEVHITLQTHQWATILLIGPRARHLLLELDRDIDISTSALPYLGTRTGTLCGAPVCLIRTGFTGDVTFEIHVEADRALELWHTIMAAGQPLGICALGEEALLRLGAEKGRVDMDITTARNLSPGDVSVSGAFALKTADFIGRKALDQSIGQRQNRLQFVALRGKDPQAIIPLNSIIEQGSTDGKVLTSFYSQALRQGLTHALVNDGHNRIGETVNVSSDEGTVAMRISRPTVFDPNERKRHG